jgi:hypothetical protein
MSETQLGDQFLYQSSLKSDPPVRVSSRKRVPYVIDLNQGSYGNGIITIDATSQLNGAEGYASLRDAYIMLPYKVSMKNSGATSFDAVANRLCASLKCGNWNVIDQMSLELNGKSILSMQEYKMFWNNLRAQSEFSTQYVDKHGAETFLYPDTSYSTLWNGTGTGTAGDGTNSGDGYINTATSVAPALGSTSTGAPSTSTNTGFVSRLLNNPPTANANTYAWPTSGNAASSKTIANQFGRGAFVAGSAATAGSVLGSWTFMLKIKLTDLHPIFKEIDLIANPQIRMRFRVNQGSSIITLKCVNPSSGVSYSTSVRTMKLASTTLSSGSTCPVMVASAENTCPLSQVIGTLGVATASATTTGEMTIAWGAVTNSVEPVIDSTYMPFTTARLYVPFLDLENPSAIISKPVKKIRYNDVYAQWFYQRAGIGIQNTQFNTAFDLQLSASIKNAKYVAVLPFAEQTNSFNSAAVQQFQSPFDSAPWTVQPGSCIRNFNVRIGSTNTFEVSHEYDFHAFSNEFSKLGAINGDLTPELVNGLIDFQKWSTTNRILVADVSRLTERDVPQAIQVMGTNAACQGVNLLVLVIFENELSYDRLTGEVLEYTSN